MKNNGVCRSERSGRFFPERRCAGFCAGSDFTLYQKEGLYELIVYFFESEICPVIHGLNEHVPAGIYNGELEIDFSNIAKWIKADMER